MCASMGYDPKYGPDAQTSAQRAYVLEQMRRATPELFTKLSPYVTQLHARYVAGELSWTQVQDLRQAAERHPFRSR